MWFAQLKTVVREYSISSKVGGDLVPVLKKEVQPQPGRTQSGHTGPPGSQNFSLAHPVQKQGSAQLTVPETQPWVSGSVDDVFYLKQECGILKAHKAFLLISK